jgi:hypothetical protein
MSPEFRRPFASAFALLSLLMISEEARAQSLRGSPASVSRMYRQAVRERLTFFRTSASVRTAVRNKRLVKLSSTDDVVLSDDVGFPYVRSQTRTFLTRLGAQYRHACGERLVVTSAVRPATRQPPNGTRRSVHPTGMAVDLRKPDGRCLTWLRATLLDLEDAGVIEATEESAPPHFHVAVFLTPYAKYVAARERETRALAARTYRVRSGDTLWEIAERYDTSVGRLVDANDLDDDAIVAGQTLVIPNR